MIYHDSDNERGKLLKNPLMHMHIVGFQDEGAVKGVGQLSPDDDVKTNGKKSAAVLWSVEIFTWDSKSVKVPDELHNCRLLEPMVQSVVAAF